MAEEHRNDGSDSGRGNHLNSDALVERRSRHEAGQTQEQEKETCPDIHSHHARIVPALASLGLAARVVADPDEEIFLLYTISAAEPDRRGLGQVDSQHDLLRITIDPFGSGVGDETRAASIRQDNVDRRGANNEQGSDRRLRDPKKAGRLKQSRQHTSNVRNKRQSAELHKSSTPDRPATTEPLTVVLRQDVTSLRSTVGDTGSVVWRSSISLATKIIRDAELSKQTSWQDPGTMKTALLDIELLRTSRILELGSGTGVLPCLALACSAIISPPSQMRWLATDQEAMLPLLSRNINDTASAHENSTGGGGRAMTALLDWVEASTIYRQGTASAVQKYLRQLFSHFESGTDGPYHTRQSRASIQGEVDRWSRPDVIVATDCIFNPSLFPVFLDTLNLLSSSVPGFYNEDRAPERGSLLPTPPLVLVVCELREPEALRQFLEEWLAPGHHGEQWCVATIEDISVLGPALVRGSVVWAAWRKT